MSWLKQSFVFAGVAVLCALGTYLVHGEYDRRVPCVQSELAEHEVCLETVLDDWGGNVVWVDARFEVEKDIMLSEALEISEAKAEDDIGTEKVTRALFNAKGTGTRIVVFCQTDGCGSSQYVRKKIIEIFFDEDSPHMVFYLHGGWKAIAGDGRLLE